MSVRERGKNWIKRSLAKSGVLRMASRLQKPGIAVLMYHSVMDDPYLHANTLGGIIHRTEMFRKQMELIARQYNAVTLDDVLQFLKGTKSLPPRPVVVTFDDGYADNLEVAAPVMNRYGVPGIVYLTVDCIEKRRSPWVSRIRYAFFTTKKKEWPDPTGRIWRWEDEARRTDAFLAACEYCARKTGAAQEKFVNEIQAALDAGPIPLEERLMLTWTQARKLVEEGHSVGSHTMTHPNMAHVDETDIPVELGESKRRMEQELARPVPHFSYPCPILQPHWSSHTVAVCRQLGYLTAVTTNSGPVRAGDDPLTLRRVPAPADLDGLHWNLECTFLGRAM